LLRRWRKPPGWFAHDREDSAAYSMFYLRDRKCFRDHGAASEYQAAHDPHGYQLPLKLTSLRVIGS
jgi:hypothetical protein